MAKDGHIAIADRAGFVAKIDEIKAAAAALRDAAKLITPIADKAKAEAASFTKDGSPAPIYADLLAELQAWATKLTQHVEAVSDSSESAAKTAYDKFIAITSTDDSGAQKIKNI